MVLTQTCRFPHGLEQCHTAGSTLGYTYGGINPLSSRLSHTNCGENAGNGTGIGQHSSAATTPEIFRQLEGLLNEWEETWGPIGVHAGHDEVAHGERDDAGAVTDQETNQPTPSPREEAGDMTDQGMGHATQSPFIPQVHATQMWQLFPAQTTTLPSLKSSGLLDIQVAATPSGLVGASSLSGEAISGRAFLEGRTLPVPGPIALLASTGQGISPALNAPSGLVASIGSPMTTHVNFRETSQVEAQVSSPVRTSQSTPLLAIATTSPSPKRVSYPRKCKSSLASRAHGRHKSRS